MKSAQGPRRAARSAVVTPSTITRSTNSLDSVMFDLFPPTLLVTMWIAFASVAVAAQTDVANSSWSLDSPHDSSQLDSSLSFDEKSLTGVDAYGWNSNDSSLAYAARDGTLWLLSGPEFERPRPLVKVALAKEQKIEQVVWSPDGLSIALVAPRATDLWDTIWLFDIKSSELRDLLPPGAPFGGAGRRALLISSWLNDERIAFVVHCGTGCLGLHAVQTSGKGFWDFCDASGSFFWSPAKTVAVVENDAEGIGPVGLGLVSASESTAISEGASYFRPQRECRSVFRGAQPCGTCGPSQVEPRFNSWFPDSDGQSQNCDLRELVAPKLRELDATSDPCNEF